MMTIKKIIVAALTGPPALPGRDFDGVDLFDAVETSVRAVAAGYDGTIYCFFDDGTIRVFTKATKTFGVPVPYPF